MKKAIAVNGSPRKNWNTATLLERALAGAASAGAETKLVHLYDLTFKGCVSCFSCKRAETYDAGRCAMRDDLSPILEELASADVLLLGSPIYLADVTGEMRSFLERAVFSNIAYDPAHRSVFKGSLACGLIYTMNVPLPMMREFGYEAVFEAQVEFLSRTFGGATEYMTANDTLQFDDYAKYHCTMFDAAHKREVREKQFPLDCERAFELGARLAS